MPPDHVTVNPFLETLDAERLVIAVGGATAMMEVDVTVPLEFAAVTTTVHDVPVNPVNVAVPVPELDGVAALPLMVYVVMTDVPAPPDHVMVNPLAEAAEEARLVIAVGGAMTVTPALLVPAVIRTDQEVPVKPVNVAVPVDDEDGMAAVPLMV